MAGTSSGYDEWHAGLGVNVALSEPWHELVRRHLDPPRDLAGKRVLEVACGRGGLARWIAGGTTRPAVMVAADISTVAVTKAASALRDRGGVRFEVADLQRMPHPARTFDTIISCETIEHVPDPRAAVAEMARLLRPGGHLFLTCPNYLGTMGLYRMYLRARGRRFTEAGQPINHVTMVPRTLEWLRSSGFKVTRWNTLGHYLHVPQRVPVRIEWLDRCGSLTRLFGLHSIFVAVRA